MSETKTKYSKRVKKMLVVRYSTLDICLKNESAAKLLSVLLFWYDNDKDAAPGGVYRIVRTQAKIVEAACDLLSAKTLKRSAIPALVLLGYIQVESKIGGDIYLVNIDAIEAAYQAFDDETLSDFIRGQLDNCLIDLTQKEIDNCLINWSIVQSQLDRCTIAIGQLSNCKRGRKTRPQAAGEVKSQAHKSIKDTYKTGSKDNSLTGAGAPDQTTDDDLLSGFDLPFGRTKPEEPISLEEKRAERDEQKISVAPPPQEKRTAAASTSTNKKRTSPRLSTKKPAIEQSVLVMPVEITLDDAAERRVWDCWATMWWFVKSGKPPVLTETAKTRCKNLKGVEWTPELMQTVVTWARSKENDRNGIYKKRPFELGDLDREWPRYVNVNGKQDKPTAPAADQEQKPGRADKNGEFHQVKAVWSARPEDTDLLQELLKTRRHTPRWDEILKNVQWSIMTFEEAKAAPVPWKSFYQFTDRQLRENIKLTREQCFIVWGRAIA